jgi:hypothetical protein
MIRSTHDRLTRNAVQKVFLPAAARPKSQTKEIGVGNQHTGPRFQHFITADLHAYGSMEFHDSNDFM